MCTFVQKSGEYQHTLISFSNFQLCGSLHLPFFFFLFQISDAVEDQTTFLLHLDTTPPIQYASMNKLTLRDLTQQTKNSSIRGSSMTELQECEVLVFNWARKGDETDV